MFIKEWIMNYINTPTIELTLADEALFYIALLIIFGAISTLIWIVHKICTRIKKR